MPGHDIVVVGGSAGGIEAAIDLCRSLPAELPAAVFVVIHLSTQHKSALTQLLSDSCSLAVTTAEDNEEIRTHHVYVAPADHHVLVSRDRMRVVRGPRYNRYRPAIDPLFHSATRSFGPRVVGIVLSGTLDDGADGLTAIRRRGGVAIVQDPNTAQFPEMPRAAMAHGPVDHRLAPREMGALLDRLAREPAEGFMPPAERRLDAEFSNLIGNKIDMSDIGKPSAFACPDCGGVLWEVGEAGVPFFHCRTGHGYSIGSLMAQQDLTVEDSLWAALRALEESIRVRRELVDHMAGSPETLTGMGERIEESEAYARRLRKLLFDRSEETSEGLGEGD